METIIINHSKHPLYPVFKELYGISFPIFEQRTEAQQEKAFSSLQYRLVTYQENDAFIGFISYWEFPTYIYVEHLAVNQTIRGKGYGSLVLNKFIADNQKIVLLEIEPVIDEVSAARLRFYQKCGFHENGYKHIHPPYRAEFKGHSLVILTTERPISEDEYNQFNDDLTQIVMKFN